MSIFFYYFYYFFFYFSNIFFEIIISRSSLLTKVELKENLQLFVRHVKSIKEFLANRIEDKNWLIRNARSISFTFVQFYICLLLLEHANWSKEEVDLIAAKRWTNILISSKEYADLRRSLNEKEDKILGLDLDSSFKPKLFEGPRSILKIFMNFV